MNATARHTETACSGRPEYDIEDGPDYIRWLLARKEPGTAAVIDADARDLALLHDPGRCPVCGGRRQ